MSDLILIDESQVVRKSEALVKSRYRLSHLPLKLITTLISSVQEQDTAEQEYIIRVKDFTDMAGLKGKDYYKKLDTATDEILSKPIRIPTGKTKRDKESFLKMNWCSSCEYVDGEGIIKFKIDSKLLPYIIKLKNKYLQYGLINILPLKSEYSIRIYEWLKDEYSTAKRYGRLPEIIVELDELRERFEVPKSYRFDNIKVQILDKAKADLTEHCDIKFEWNEEAKIRKKVTHIKFKIYPNRKNIPENVQLPPYLDTFIDYVNYLRDLYKLTSKYFYVGNMDIGNGAKTYYFCIDKNGYMVAMLPTGGEGVRLQKQQAEVVYNASYLCSQYSEIYREFVETQTDFWKLDEENPNYFGVLIKEIKSVTAEHSPRYKPMF